ncbi:EpsI family protein [Desulfatiferula olefinivorans]
MNSFLKQVSSKRLYILSALMLAAFLYVKFMNHGREMQPLQPFSSFPKTINEWKGKEQFFSKEIYDAVGVDDSVLVDYSNPSGESVQLYIGFYRSQRKGDLIHSPKNCMPGSGWEITRTSMEDLTLSDERPIRIIKLDLEKGPQKMIVLYWFHSRGRIINSEYKQKIYLVWDSIFRNRTDGSFVRLISTVDKESPEETLDSVKTFATQLLPILDDFIPQ